MPEPPDNLAAALITLQTKLPRITKDDEAQVGTRTYAYANLATIHDAVMPLLCELGLTWTCRPTLLDTGTFVLAYSLRHAASGEQETGDYPLPTSGSPQQIGSAITYARRYTLTAVLGIAPAEDDDDGQGAEQAARKAPKAAADPASGRMTRAQARDHNRIAAMDTPPHRQAEVAAHGRIRESRDHRADRPPRLRDIGTGSSGACLLE